MTLSKHAINRANQAAVPASRPRSPLVTLQFTRHLFAFFPHLAEGQVQVQAQTVAQALAALEALAPGIDFYLRDERGRVRHHVQIFIGNERIRDRRGQSDPLQPGDTVWILQALSGG